MDGKGGARPVNIDPQWCIFRDAGPFGRLKLTPGSIQETLRMHFQPIKNEDPQVDFHTMYKREAMEYDTEYMKKYNDDLNTTPIFVGLYDPVYPTQR